jgi:hypothetical protein
VSTYHVSLDSSDRLALASAHASSTVIASLRDAASAVVAGFVARFHAHGLKRGMARYSDHLLSDVGFERDWDGTIVPMVHEPNASE